MNKKEEVPVKHINQIPENEMLETEEVIFSVAKSLKKLLKYGILALGGTGISDSLIKVDSSIDVLISAGAVGVLAAILNILKYKFNLKWLP